MKNTQTFTIILPIMGAVNLFEDTIASVLRHRPDRTEIIVVHDGNYDDPYDLAGDNVEFVTINKRAKLIRLFNAGVKRAQGDIVGFLRPGCELSADWHYPVIDAFSDPEVGSVAPVLVKRNQSKRALATGVGCGTGFRRKLEGVGKSIRSIDFNRLDLYGPTSWAGFYRGDLLAVLIQETGTLDESLDQHYLDLELGLSLRTMGYDCEPCPECLVSVASPSAVKREARTPHGGSAHRAFVRHVMHIGTISNKFRRYWTIATELATCPLQPWKLLHALQRNRRLTQPSREDDEIFSDDISVAARKLAMAKKPSAGNRMTHAVPFESEKRRRAA